MLGQLLWYASVAVVAARSPGRELYEAFCGAVDGEGLHAPQSWVLLARCLHALAVSR